MKLKVAASSFMPPTPNPELCTIVEPRLRPMAFGCGDTQAADTAKKWQTMEDDWDPAMATGRL